VGTHELIRSWRKLELQKPPFLLPGDEVLSDTGHTMAESDEFGAHVSSSEAPARAAEIESVCFQLFTKQPSRWAEPTFDQEKISAFRDSWQHHRIRFANAHDSYLINLASPNPALWERLGGHSNVSAILLRVQDGDRKRSARA